MAAMISAVSSDSHTVVDLNKKHAVLLPSSFTNFLIIEDSLNVMFYGIALHNVFNFLQSAEEDSRNNYIF